MVLRHVTVVLLQLLRCLSGCILCGAGPVVRVGAGEGATGRPAEARGEMGGLPVFGPARSLGGLDTRRRDRGLESRAWPGPWGPAGFRKLRPSLALRPCGVRPGPGPLELGSQAQAAPPGSGGVAGALEPLLTSEKANFSFWLCF